MSGDFDRAGGDLVCRMVGELRRVLRGGIMGHCIATTVLVLGAGYWVLGIGPDVHGSALGAPHAAPSTLRADLPDAAAVAEAFLRARRWVDAFDPPALDDPAARLPIEHATGVCVILRSAGRVVGTGTAVIGADSEPDLLLRRAVGRALADVLGDPAVMALEEERRGEIGGTLTIEIEIAGGFAPLLGRDFHRIAQQVEPGLDGVAMRRGESRAMIFPSQLRAVNAAGNIHSRLPGLATELGLAPADLATLQRRHSVSMHRFRTTHLAQDSPSRFPFETFRGDRIVSLHEVTNETIADFADGLAAHLIGRLWNSDGHRQIAGSPASRLPDDDESADEQHSQSPFDGPTAVPSAHERLALGMRGDYDPIGDTYRPIVAPPLDQALAALALMRYAAAPFTDSAGAERARDAAVAILVDLETVEEGELDPLRDPAACAAIVMILAEHPALARKDRAIERLSRAAVEVVYNSFDAESGFVFNGSALPPHTQAVLAAAIAKRLTQRDAALELGDPERARGYSRSAIDAAWASVPAQQHVTLLPWIGWAEVAYAEATGEPLENAEALRNVRATLEEARSLASADFEPDLVGGFPLAVGDAGGGMRPTAQTIRPAAFFAAMLRCSSMTPEDERSAASERHRETMRFLVQLAVRESSSWSMRSPGAAAGGVRASPWDARMPTAPQALALLTAVETLANPR